MVTKRRLAFTWFFVVWLAFAVALFFVRGWGRADLLALAGVISAISLLGVAAVSFAHQTRNTMPRLRVETALEPSFAGDDLHHVVCMVSVINDGEEPAVDVSATVLVGLPLRDTVTDVIVGAGSAQITDEIGVAVEVAAGWEIDAQNAPLVCERPIRPRQRVHIANVSVTPPTPRLSIRVECANGRGSTVVIERPAEKCFGE